MRPRALPTLNRTPGRFLCLKRVFGFFFFWWWLFVSFLTPCQCAKIPAAVELQANVVKANRCVCWRASLDDTGLLQSYLKRVFIIFYGAKQINRQVGLQPYEFFSQLLSFQKNHHQRKIMTYWHLTHVPSSSLGYPWSLKCVLVLPEAPFALKDTGNSLPVILLCKYLHSSPFAQLPFSQIYAKRSKNEAFSKVQDELGNARSQGEEIPPGWKSCWSHPVDFGGARVSPGYVVLPCQSQNFPSSLVGITPS